MQIKAPTPEQRQVIARLSRSNDGKLLGSYLVDALAEAQQKLALSDDPARVRLIQGEYRTLLDLTNLFDPKNPVS